VGGARNQKSAATPSILLAFTFFVSANYKRNKAGGFLRQPHLLFSKKII
jgi:hypothetical protein